MSNDRQIFNQADIPGRASKAVTDSAQRPHITAQPNFSWDRAESISPGPSQVWDRFLCIFRGEGSGNLRSFLSEWACISYGTYCCCSLDSKSTSGMCFLSICRCYSESRGAHPLIEPPCQGSQLLLQGPVLVLNLIRVPHCPVVVASGVPIEACKRFIRALPMPALKHTMADSLCHNEKRQFCERRHQAGYCRKEGSLRQFCSAPP